jgi:Tol biopolymer transport system component
LGGGATLLISNASEPAASPDGKRIAFVRTDDSGDQHIWHAEFSDLSKEHQLTKEKDGLWWRKNPAWSPDGTTVCYETRSGLRVISLDGSPSIPLTSDKQLDFDPVWSSDGRHIYFSSYRDGTTPAIWRIKSSGGRAQPVTWGAGVASHPTLSQDRTRLAYTTEDLHHILVFLDLETGEKHELPNVRDDWMPTLSPDRSAVVFGSDRRRTDQELWIQDLNGTEPTGPLRPLKTNLGVPSFPAFSPDGEWIAFHRILDGRRDIMTLSLSTGQSHQFTDDPDDDVRPAWSPDASRLTFASLRSGTWQIWIAGVENGRRASEPWQLTREKASAQAPSWSPDGGMIAYVGHQGNHNDVFVIEPEAGSTPQQITRHGGVSAVAWNAATGNLLVAAPWEEGTVTLRNFSRTGEDLGPTRHAVVFGERSNYTQFAVSVDGRIIVYSRQQLTGKVCLFKSEKQPY